jgi:hypothetical protein
MIPEVVPCTFLLLQINFTTNGLPVSNLKIQLVDKISNWAVSYVGAPKKVQKSLDKAMALI